MYIDCNDCKGRGYNIDWNDVFLCIIGPLLIPLLFQKRDKNGFGRIGCDNCNQFGTILVEDYIEEEIQDGVLV